MFESDFEMVETTFVNVEPTCLKVTSERLKLLLLGLNLQRRYYFYWVENHV